MSSLGERWERAKRESSPAMALTELFYVLYETGRPMKGVLIHFIDSSTPGKKGAARIALYSGCPERLLPFATNGGKDLRSVQSRRAATAARLLAEPLKGNSLPEAWMERGLAVSKKLNLSSLDLRSWLISRIAYTPTPTGIRFYIKPNDR